MISLQSAINSDILIYFLSEEAVSVVFGQEINEVTFKRISEFNALLTDNPFTGFRTTVVSYTTLSVFYSPMEVMQSAFPGTTCFEKVCAYLRLLNANSKKHYSLRQKRIEIPTCYGGIFGPDLQEIAFFNRLSEEEVIHLHSSAVYKVYMIGFVPGFAYMGGMDERLATPRKAQPRQSVHAGSVGIAGKQTGIYPLSIPGGWQILGRTPIHLFDINRMRPSFLEAGDEVRFKAIDEQRYYELSNLKDGDQDH
ncbi:5-oxoprolinase subunit PxpB [Pedobacter frigidisoli]|uniref:5-oxoprolinase subunit PxpB n=1 Tax=Pedobacter frigidisoli TaxID=2530455 RepID=UPI002930219A|nr:5-oxoprolinase subunit PxpB [Pedobacter frigidisoli]